MFYVIGLLITLMNLIAISKHKRVFYLKEWFVKFNSLTGNNPKFSDYRKKGDKEIILGWSICIVSTAAWVFFGLLSSVWYIFAFIILINVIMDSSVKLLGEFSKISFGIILLKNIITTLIIGFIVINNFHLHIDILNIIGINK